MNYKHFIFIFIIILIGITSVIVWNNRASDKLISNFLSVIILGLSGLLITSLISLKDEVVNDFYPANMFLKKQPLTLMNYNPTIPLKSNRIKPIIFTNNGLDLYREKNPNFEKEIFPLDKPEKWDNIAELFVRYIFDLLETRYAGSWYIKGLEYKAPNSLSGMSMAIEKEIEINRIKWSQIGKQLNNKFITCGYSKSESGVIHDFGIAIPKDIKLKYTKSSTFYILTFENEFVKIEWKFRPRVSVNGSVNKEMKEIFKINHQEESNYLFVPIIFETKSTFKKFRSGHPDMNKYKYWEKDMREFLKKHISIDEFWKIIELNKN